MRAHDRLPDKVSDGLIREVAFEFIPGSDQTACALELQVHERPQRTEDVVANGVLPTHEEPLGMAGVIAEFVPYPVNGIRNSIPSSGIFRVTGS